MKPPVLAVLAALIVAAGVAMIYLPAGVIALGLEGLAGAYMKQYLEARR